MSYSIPYGLSYLWILKPRSGTWILRYGLSIFDFAAITAAVMITGGPQIPFFYLYPIPFLVHALQFDIRLIIWDGAWSVLCYGGTLWVLRNKIADHHMDLMHWPDRLYGRHHHRRDLDSETLSL